MSVIALSDAARADVRFEGRDLGGTIYLMAGRDMLNADLYRMRGSLDRVERLTVEGRVSVMAAYEDVLVLSNARGSGSDRLEVADLTDGEALPGTLLDPYGQAPDFSPSGRLLYSVELYTKDGGDAGTRIYITKPRPRAKKRVLYRSKRSVFTYWGPGERLAVHRYRSPKLVLDPGGPRREVVNPRIGGWRSFETSNSDLMLFQNRERVAIVPPTGPARRFTTSWDHIGWSPRGRRVVVARRGRLGLMSPRTGAVRAIGTYRGGKVFAAEWVEGKRWTK